MSGPAPVGGKHWSSRLMFLIASIGFAVGLGNLWRFPYLAGENGGGAFILLYVLAVGLIGLPLVIVELAVGRAGGPDPTMAWAKVAQSERASSLWRVIGWLGVGASFLIVSFYGVIGGWTFAFAWNAGAQLVAGAPPLDFGGMLASPGALVFWQTLFVLANLAIIRLGLKNGVERAMSVLMPLLLLLLLAMLAIAASQASFAKALAFLFVFDPAYLTFDTAVSAVGQAFFSVGVAAAVLVTYGGSLGPRERIGKLAAIIVVADTLVALLAGLIIFPFVFSAGLDPTEGPTLLFVTMQAAFASLPGGTILGLLFFGLVASAALTSSLALFEMLAAIGEARGLARGRLLVGAGVVLWVLGLGTVVSFNIGAEWHPLGMIPLFEEATFFGAADILASNLAMPAGGLLAALFAGWATPRAGWAERLGWDPDGAALSVWLLLLRFVIPLTLAIALVNGVTG